MRCAICGERWGLHCRWCGPQHCDWEHEEIEELLRINCNQDPGGSDFEGVDGGPLDGGFFGLASVESGDLQADLGGNGGWFYTQVAAGPDEVLDDLECGEGTSGSMGDDELTEPADDWSDVSL